MQRPAVLCDGRSVERSYQAIGWAGGRSRNAFLSLSVRYQVKIDDRHRRQRQCANVVGVHDTVFADLISLCRNDSSPIVMVMVMYMTSVGVGVGMDFDLLEAGCDDTEQHGENYRASAGQFHCPGYHRLEHCHNSGGISITDYGEGRQTHSSHIVTRLPCGWQPAR